MSTIPCSFLDYTRHVSDLIHTRWASIDAARHVATPQGVHPPPWPLTTITTGPSACRTNSAAARARWDAECGTGARCWGRCPGGSTRRTSGPQSGDSSGSVSEVADLADLLARSRGAAGAGSRYDATSPGSRTPSDVLRLAIFVATAAGTSRLRAAA